MDLQPDVRGARLGPEERAPHRPVPALHQVRTRSRPSCSSRSVQAWQITPLAALLVLAATQSIPDELYESARVDGATWYQHITRITLPLARPAIAIATAEALVMSINIFDQVYVLNAAATTGSSLMSQTYFITFQDLNFGQGYALSLFATVVTIVLSLRRPQGGVPKGRVLDEAGHGPAGAQ